MQQPLLNESFATELLMQMIAIESTTCNESRRADLLEESIGRYGESYGFRTDRIGNNLVFQSTSCNSAYNSSASCKTDTPTLLMVSHIDTVPAAKDYSFPPSEPFIKDNKLFGLGTNDDGGSVVCMVTAALNYFLKCKENNPDKDCREDKNNVNLILVLSAEEEKSGSNGLSLVLDKFRDWEKEDGRFRYPDFAIIGEPTGLKMAAGERGLLVIDCVAKGKAGHAARDEGDNAIYKAIDDINILRSLSLPKRSPLFGDVKITTTIFNGGTLHNIVPGEAKFTVDMRTTECYSNRELVDIISSLLQSSVTARNLNNKTSVTPQENHFGKLLLNAGALAGLDSFLSPTTSDWMRLDIPAVKVGPGDSARSHKADEYITKDEIVKGIELYSSYIDELNKLI